MTVPSWSLVWKLPFVAALGYGLLSWIASRTGDRRLRQVILVSYAVRFFLGVTLYAISYWKLPLLSSLQAADGFWSFGLDSNLYHDLGVRMADAWKHGIELPEPGMGHEYLAIIGATYWLLDAHPLYAILLHCWLGALTGWLAYRIGQRLFDRASGLRGAFFVSFWPSSLLWSSQILKDAPTWCLTLIILWLVVLLIGSDARPFRMRVWRWGLQIVALGSVIILLTRLRIYMGSVLSLVAFVVLVPASCACLFNRRMGQAVSRFARAILPLVGRAIGLGGLAALVIGAVVVARDLNTNRLFSPAHPEKGYVRLGLQHQQRGEFALAEAEFKRAIELRPDDQQAYLLWASMLSMVNRPVEAYQVCVSWPSAYSDGTMHRCLDQLGPSLGEQLLVRKLDSKMAFLPQALVVRLELPEPTKDQFHITVSDGELTAMDELMVNVGDFSVLAPMASVTARADLTAGETQPTSAMSAGPSIPHSINHGLLAILHEMSPQWLASLRGSIIVGGGNLLVDVNKEERTDISQPLHLITYLPRALLIGLLAPFPWQWFDTSGSTGAMRIFSGAEMTLAYLILIGLALRAWRAIGLVGLIGCVRLAIRQMGLGGLFILVYGLVMAVSMSLVMVNLGTFFRIRLLFWLPLLILVAAGDPLGSYGWYRRLIEWMGRWRSGPDIAAIRSAQEPAVPTAPVSVAGLRGDQD